MPLDLPLSEGLGITPGLPFGDLPRSRSQMSSNFNLTAFETSQLLL
jgi:hypothetical protein